VPAASVSASASASLAQFSADGAAPTSLAARFSADVQAVARPRTGASGLAAAAARGAARAALVGGQAANPRMTLAQMSRLKRPTTAPMRAFRESARTMQQCRRCMMLYYDGARTCGCAPAPAADGQQRQRYATPGRGRGATASPARVWGFSK